MSIAVPTPLTNTMMPTNHCLQLHLKGCSSATTCYVVGGTLQTIAHARPERRWRLRIERHDAHSPVPTIRPQTIPARCSGVRISLEVTTNSTMRMVVFFLQLLRPPTPTLFPYTTLFR